MYLTHFGFEAAPFGLTANPDFLYTTRSVREALETLRVAVETGEGIVKITGEVGSGKTLLCNAFIRDVPLDNRVIHLVSPALPPDELYIELGWQLGIKPVINLGVPHITEIHRALIKLAKTGRRLLLCLDEAQIMASGSLEALRLLSNLELDDRKLVQIVLFGQPELDQRLRQKNMRQFKQRITFDYRLRGIAPSELVGYLEYRTYVAGRVGSNLFTPGALWLLNLASRGLPRLVNLLCHKALMLAYGRQRYKVDWSDMMLAIQDSAAVFDVLPIHHWLWMRLLR